MLGSDVLDEDIAAGGSGSHHIAAGLDLIRDDAVSAAVHLLHAAHLDDIGTGATDIRTAHIQEVGQIDHMGLLGAVFQNGLALGHDSGEHPVHGSAHADLIKEDMRSVELLGTDGDHAVIHAVLCAQGAENFQVLVDGAGAQVAAAGHGHLCLAETGQQCTQEVIAGAHLARQVIRDIGARQVGGVDLIGVLVQHLDLCAQGAQDLEADGHIADIRQVFNDADIGCQNGGGQDAHCRVLCAGDGNLTMQGFAARNNKFFQFYDLLVVGPLRDRPYKVHFQSTCRSFFRGPVCREFSGRKTKPQQLQLPYYTREHGKSKAPVPFCPLFSVLPRIHEDIPFFCLFFQKFYNCPGRFRRTETAFYQT